MIVIKITREVSTDMYEMFVDDRRWTEDRSGRFWAIVRSQRRKGAKFGR